MPTPDTIRSELLSNPRLRHGFFTRRGGVSQSIYASLNCAYSSNDHPPHVGENRSRVAGALGIEVEVLYSPRQAHTTRVLTIDQPIDEETPVADGLVTKIRGVGLSVLGADCAPVLMADLEAQVIGAAHAGWRGALEGVLESTLDAMLGLGAGGSDVVACIGPTIQQQSYEVGAEFRDRFVATTPRHETFFVAGNEGRFQFDLPRFIESRLSDIGVGTVERLSFDTCSDEERFFSYRRATRRDEPDYGRQISAIVLA